MRIPAVIVVIGLVALASNSKARIWHVERDGSGDYVVIQDAVNAAAGGDTIRIGPGRYDEGQVCTFPGWTAFVRVVVNKPNLTFIGSGPATIIGQSEPWNSAQGEHRGIFARVDEAGPGQLVVNNIRFENTWTALDTEEIDVEVNECSYVDNCYGCVLWRGSAATIHDCRFDRIPSDGKHVLCWSQDHLEIADCTFILADIPPGSQGHIGLEGVQDGLIANCEFRDAMAGVSVSSGSHCTIRACNFDGRSSTALYAAFSFLYVEDSVFCNLGAVMYVGYIDVEFRRCRVENVERCSFGLSIIDRFVVTDCDLARGREGVVVVSDGMIGCEPRHLDFSNNYWGTDNPDSIRAWIHDANDSDRSCYYIDYEPFRSESMAAEKKSMGDVKALYR